MAHILVVDDERDVVTLIKFLLEKNGHTVSTAYNGAEALKALGIEPEDPKDRSPQAASAGPHIKEVVRPDLIVLDFMMPVIGGMAVAERIAQVETLKNVPLIVLSAKGQIQEDFRKLKLETHFLGKPFDPKKLHHMIDTLLKGDSPG